ncbi:MAG: hypothetical protein WA755_19910 [Candidatus Acidiferrales bacterium]
MSSSGKRAIVVVVVLLVLILGAVGYYFLRGHAPALVVAPGAPPDLLSLLPPNAPVIAFADVAALRASPNFGMQSPVFNSSAEEDPDYQEWEKETGFHWNTDLDRLAIAAWPDYAKKLPNGAPRVALVALADGRFDQGKISAYAARFGTVTKHGADDIYEVPSSIPNEKLSFTFLSPTRMALAQEMSLDPVLAPSGNSGLDPATRERIAHVAGATFFAVMRTDNLPQTIAIPGLQSGQLNHLLKSIRSVTVAGHPDGAKLVIAAEADCNSFPNALQLSTTLDALRWIGRAALADPKTRQQMRPSDAAALDTLLKIASISHQDHWVRIRLDLTPEILQAAAPSSK